MKKIRIGNDIKIKWTILRNGDKESFLNKKVDVMLLDVFSKPAKITYSITDNVIDITFFGKDQDKVGNYRLLLVENNGEAGMNTLDKCDAFYLTPLSCNIGGSTSSNIEVETIELTSETNIPANGLSAYEIAVKNGFVGDEKAWLESLKGEDGKKGEDGIMLYPTYNVDSEMHLQMESAAETDNVQLEDNGHLIFNL